MVKRNVIAKELAKPLYRLKIVKNKKGKGAYSRKGKRPISLPYLTFLKSFFMVHS